MVLLDSQVVILTRVIASMSHVILFLLVGLAVYAVLGMAFAVPFLCRGIQAIDPATVRSPKHVRLLLLPGVVVVWPVLLRRWATLTKPERIPEQE